MSTHCLFDVLYPASDFSSSSPQASDTLQSINSDVSPPPKGSLLCVWGASGIKPHLPHLHLWATSRTASTQGQISLAASGQYVYFHPQGRFEFEAASGSQSHRAQFWHQQGVDPKRVDLWESELRSGQVHEQLKDFLRQRPLALGLIQQDKAPNFAAFCDANLMSYFKENWPEYLTDFDPTFEKMPKPSLTSSYSQALEHLQSFKEIPHGSTPSLSQLSSAHIHRPEARMPLFFKGAQSAQRLLRFMDHIRSDHRYHSSSDQTSRPMTNSWFHTCVTPVCLWHDERWFTLFSASAYDNTKLAPLKSSIFEYGSQAWFPLSQVIALISKHTAEHEALLEPSILRSTRSFLESYFQAGLTGTDQEDLLALTRLTPFASLFEGDVTLTSYLQVLHEKDQLDQVSDGLQDQGLSSGGTENSEAADLKPKMTVKSTPRSL